jgi:hypothetical protein
VATKYDLVVEWRKLKNQGRIGSPYDRGFTCSPANAKK